MSPEYFFDRLTPSEAADFLEGYHRRVRDAWERSRIGWFITVNDGKGNKTPQSLFPLPWDIKPKSKHPSKKELAALMATAKKIEAKLNGRKNGSE